jgi:hypothetical protein
VTVLGLVISFLLATVAVAATPATRPVWMSRFAWAVGTCETPNGHEQWPHFDHHAGAYEGFVGWAHTTWLLDRYPGMPEHAYQATPRQQYRVALRSFARRRHFGCISGGGYLAWMAT